MMPATWKRSEGLVPARRLPVGNNQVLGEMLKDWRLQGEAQAEEEELRCSNIGAIVMTPLLTKVLAGQLVPVDAAGLAISTFQVVLAPTIVGVLVHEYFPKFTEPIIKITPLIGVILATLLCASPIAQFSEVLKSEGAQLIVPVALLHAAAFVLGYWLSRLSTFGECTSRTISIECGMQSSALGFRLAQKHFRNPLVAAPSAVSFVCMAVGGISLAVFWRNSHISVNDKDDFKE